jgi:hypothetical protein
MSRPKCTDGRRNNCPPDHSKIRKREVRNPDGRRGKPGKVSQIDEFYLEEARRVVSHDENGVVIAGKRLVQEEYAEALIGKDPKARARVLEKLAAVEAAKRRELNEFHEWVLTCQAKYEELFYQAEITRSIPPDVAHPSHIEICADGVIQKGPIDRSARIAWEELKGFIKIAAWLHSRAREKWKANPSPQTTKELKLLEAYRRSLMRHVPKGWNWQENIYCRYSRTKFVEKSIADLEALT